MRQTRIGFQRHLTVHLVAPARTLGSALGVSFAVFAANLQACATLVCNHATVSGRVIIQQYCELVNYKRGYPLALQH